MKKDRGVDNLNLDIQNEEIKRFIDEYDRAEKKQLKLNFKEFLLYAIPSSLIILNSFVFKISEITLLLVITLSSTVVLKVYKDIKRDFGILKDKKDLSTSDVLNKGIRKIDHSDFFTCEYENLIKNMEEKNIQYRPSYIKMVKGENILNKEDTLERLIYELDTYYYTYKLPKFNVSDIEWDIIYNSLYDSLENKDEYYKLSSKLLKKVLASSLVNNYEEINVYHFIDALENIDLSENILNEKQTLELKKEVLKQVSELNNDKVIKFKKSLKITR